MSALVVDNIGLLVTGDPSVGEGSLGLVRDAALVIDDEHVAAIEDAGAAGDARIDAAGRCVIPASSTAIRTSSSPATAPMSLPPGWQVARTRRAGSG